MTEDQIKWDCRVRLSSSTAGVFEDVYQSRIMLSVRCLMMIRLSWNRILRWREGTEWKEGREKETEEMDGTQYKLLNKVINAPNAIMSKVVWEALLRERQNPQKRKIRTVGVMQKKRLKGNGSKRDINGGERCVAYTRNKKTKWLENLH